MFLSLARILHEGFVFYGQAGKKSSGKIFCASPLRANAIFCAGQNIGHKKTTWTICNRVNFVYFSVAD